MKSLKGDNLFFLIFCLFFISPILIVIYQFKFNLDFPLNQYFKALTYSLLNSSLAVLICMLIALILAPPLVKWPFSKIKWLLQGLLSPIVLPSLFTFLILFSYFKKFPFGWVGMTLTFVVVYVGFAIHSIYHAYKVKIHSLSLIAEIYNLSFLSKWIYIYLPILKTDIITSAQVIFIGCMTSLSIPMLAGGGKSGNLELFLYESVFIDGQWGMIAYFAVLQVLLIYTLQFVLKQFSKHANFVSDPFQYAQSKIDYKSWIALIVLNLMVLFYWGGFLFQVIKSIFKINYSTLLLSDFIQALINTGFLVFQTLSLMLILIVAVIYFKFKNLNYERIYNLMLPSSVVVGLSLFILFKEASGIYSEIFKVSLGMIFLYSLSLIKSYLNESLDKLTEQLKISNIFNINFFNILIHIVFPQIKKSIFMIFLLMTLYSLFDFAFIKVVSVENIYTGPFIERLISSYRLEYGFFYSAVMLLLLSIIYFIFGKIFVNASKDKNVSY